MKQKYAFNCLKTILVLLITISSTNNLNSQTVLTEGDIAFTRINMDDESFSFVFLVPIANTTQFIITDETWNSSNALGNSESKIRFTATSSFLAGEEISISSATLSFASTGFGTATLTSIGAINPALGNMLGSAGDNLFIYQPEGTPSVNDFVAGINANSGVSGTPGNAWQIVSTSSTPSSGLPSGLTNGTNALGIYPFGGAQSEVDNARYKSTALRSGDKATVLAAIMNLSNWEYHNSVVQAPVGTSFTITGGNAAPTASNFTATPSQNSVHTFATADFSYSDGDGDPIAHLRVTAIPGNGTLYVDANANDAYDSGEQLANGSTVSKTNLDAGNLQYYNNDGTSSSFTFDVNDGTVYSSSTYTTTLTVTGITSPTVTTTTASAIATTSATIGGNVIATGGATVSDRGIVWNTSANPTTANNKVSNGTGTGSFSGTVSSLPESTVIYYRSFATNSVGTSYGSESDFTTLTSEPTSAASSIVISSVSATSMTVSCTDGNGSDRMVIARASSAVNTRPTDYTAGYSANAEFGSGTDLGSGNYIVYSGTGSTVTVTGLSATTTYHFEVIEFNGSGITANYFLTGAPIGNQSTLATEPTSAASSITFSSITETGMTVGWTNGNGARRIVVAKSGSAVSADPVDGTTGYSANAAFGSGTDLGSNNYIIYDGTGTSVAVTGLSAATTYHYKVIEVNGSGATANYYLTGAPTSNQASQNAPVTITSIVRQAPTDATTDADQVVFRVTFDKGVENVDITDFALSGTSAADGTVSTVTPVSVSIYDVTVTGLTNSNGTINLDIKGNDGVSGSNNIAELAGAALSQTTTGNTIAQPEIGQSFTAAATGDFTDVTFYMNIAATYSGAGTLELRSGEGLTGTVLATETVNFVDQGTAYQQKFTFSTPATVTLGNVYTIRISGAFGNSLTFDAKTGDPFAGGMIYIPSPLASADLTFEATISTGVGALLSTVAPTTDETYTISNNVAPTVTSVTVPANATYLVDQNLDFIINFDENVTVNTGGGTPQMSLTIGATTRQATYQSGTGTSGLLFRYTVQNGDLDTDGVVVGTLAANGGTIQDADNADATLTLNSIGATTAVLVDATATTATLTTVDASSVDSVSAALGGDVTTDGGDTVTERGIVYAITSTNNNPTIGDTGVTKNDNGSGIGTFSESITGLTANTQYSYAAYAINSQGTSYGTVKTFTTSALGVETDFLQKSISVYPNPVADALYIDVNNAIEVENVKLYDVSGKLLKTPMLINKKIDFSDINNGLYFIKINTKQGALTKLIVKK